MVSTPIPSHGLILAVSFVINKITEVSLILGCQRTLWEEESGIWTVVVNNWKLHKVQF